MSTKLIPSDNMARVLVLTVLVLFTAGVLYAGYVTHLVAGHPKPGQFPARLTDFMLVIGNTLAVVFGAFLGFTAAFENWSTASAVGQLQKVASYLYIANVIVAVAFWAWAGFTDDVTKVAAVIPAIASGGIGVMLAMFGKILGVKILQMNGEPAALPGTPTLTRR